MLFHTAPQCFFDSTLVRLTVFKCALEINFTNAPSSVMVYPKEDVELREKNTLICYVTGFYPAPVNFYWTKNGENVTQGTSTNVPYPNKDGSFNQFSRLEFIPQLGDIYSCTVKHLALDQPLTRIWADYFVWSNQLIRYYELALTAGLTGF
uniref:Ig-like domain-containing protein n=1 Tax=Sander lucioperca TaxID=283035 RepID=A0A8D0D4V5_SANLU